MKQDPILVSWSKSQGGVRYETLTDHVRMNRLAFDQNRRSDFVPIEVCATLEEANEFFEKNRAVIERRFDASRKERGVC